jgi:hypothetical protein
MHASKTWKDDKDDTEDGVDDFAEGDNQEELELDTFRYIII